jgi:hypothetical protein
MNERIRELQFQAAAQIPPLLEASEWQREFTKKFAELMVKEVTNIVLHYTDVDEGVAVAKKHFGVE